MTKVAFFGVGNMGRPMAANLVKAGFEVHVFDVVPALIEEAVKMGAKNSGSLEKTLTGAEFVVSMLPASNHVKELYLAPGKILALAPKSALLIDCSTIAPQASTEVNDAAVKAGFQMIDAPVSGGTGGAAAGTLTFMVGGDAANLERARPLLSAMGKNIFHAGTNGAGQTAKVCNNMLLAIHMIGTSEALNLGVKCGMDPAKLSEILSKSSGRNWSLEVYNPYPGVMEAAPANKQYQGGFAVDLMLKDLGLAEETAKNTHTSTPLGKQAKEIYAAHSKQGSGRLDFSSVIKYLAEQDG